jgi:hypothetical protein
MPCLFCVMWTIGAEPYHQIELGGREDRPRRQRRLGAAGVALPQCTPFWFAVRQAPARRTREAFRPAPGESASRHFSSFRRAARTPRPTGLVETAPCCVPSRTSLTALGISAIRKAGSRRGIVGTQEGLYASPKRLRPLEVDCTIVAHIGSSVRINGADCAPLAVRSSQHCAELGVNPN